MKVIRGGIGEVRGVGHLSKERQDVLSRALDRAVRNSGGNVVPKLRERGGERMNRELELQLEAQRRLKDSNLKVDLLK